MASNYMWLSTCGGWHELLCNRYARLLRKNPYPPLIIGQHLIGCVSCKDLMTQVDARIPILDVNIPDYI